MARRATGIKQLQEQNPRVLILDAGNALTGQPIADRSRGLAVVEAMNLMGYHALALGRQDLALSVTELRAVIDQAQFKVLSANAVLADTGELLAEPYAVIKIGEQRVGVLGLTGLDASNPALTIKGPLTVVQEYVPQLEKEADLIVVLSNAGLDVNQQIGTQVPGIDVIVSGGGPVTALNPPQVLSPSNTLLVQAGYQGQWLGVLGLDLDDEHNVKDHAGELWKLTRVYPDDPDLVALVDRYKIMYNIPTPTPEGVPTPTSSVPGASSNTPSPTVQSSYPQPATASMAGGYPNSPDS